MSKPFDGWDEWAVSLHKAGEHALECGADAIGCMSYAAVSQGPKYFYQICDRERMTNKLGDEFTQDHHRSIFVAFVGAEYIDRVRKFLDDLTDERVAKLNAELSDAC